MAFSRDDADSFLRKYIDEGIFRTDPFRHFGSGGVGELIEKATSRARKTKPDIKLGICGSMAVTLIDLFRERVGALTMFPARRSDCHRSLGGGASRYLASARYGGDL